MTEPHRLRSIIGFSLVGLVLALVVIALAVSCHREATVPVVDTYQGIVVDKWAVYSHSYYGSFPYYRLLVKKQSGERIRVPVSYEDYQKARVGMWVRKTGNHFEAYNPPNSISASSR
ncbi:MAG TPA: hypothetical protein VN643_06155 [Pyrinomonadaceae bacterium]|nr:hypothetical protein [Pyrinomonadaceae bacterium]